jgi:hypothetical protein
LVPQFLQDCGELRPCVGVELTEAVREHSGKIHHVLYGPARGLQALDPFFAVVSRIVVGFQILDEQPFHRCGQSIKPDQHIQRKLILSEVIVD